MIAGAPSNDAQLLEISQRVFTRMLVLYSREYRQEYGPQMAQLFKDCSRGAVGHGGAAALLTLWTATLLDLFKTAFEEHFKELTHMSKEKFTRLGGWALIVGALLLLPLLGLGDLENWLGSWSAYINVGLGPLCMLLLATGTLALRNAYGSEASATGKAALGFSVIAAVVAGVGAVGLGLVLRGEIWWTLFFIGYMLHLLGIGLFGVTCIQKKALPGLNWLLAAGGLAMPTLGIVSIVIQFDVGMLVTIVSIGLALLAYFAAGSQLLRTPALKARAAR